MDNGHINPWLHIWVHPKKTMRSILDTNPKKTILWLAMLSGILSGVLFTLFFWHMEWPLFLKILFPIGMVIGGAIFGVLLLYFEGWLYTLTGSWIGGKGTFIELKCAAGWRNYPGIIVILFNLFSVMAIPHVWLQGLFGLCQLIFAIWALVISANLIGEAHRFSAWKGLLTLLIAAALVTLLFMLLGLLVPLLSPLFQ